MAYSLIAGGSGVGAIAAVDTSTANLIVLFVHQNNTTDTVSDSKSNTWTPLTAQAAHAGDNTGRLWYCVSPTVGAAHTFACSVAYGAICMLAYAGAAAVPFDQENGAKANSGTSGQPGTVTPSEDNELIVQGCGLGEDTSGPAINSGLTLRHSVDSVSGVSYGASISDLIETSLVAKNPTSSWTGSANNTQCIATFKAAAASGVVGPLIRGRLVKRGILQGRLAA